MVVSIQHFITSPLDVTLVDNTPRLLNILNSTERLSKLLNKRDDRGYTLLHAAAERNQPESLKCLLIKEGTYMYMYVVLRSARNTMQPLYI
jgi:ankyrin repeat protein